MNIHEYQAKQLFKEYGVPIPKGGIASSADEALAIVDKLDSKSWVVKAQVHAGGRGKAGGVKIVDNKKELSDVVKGMLGSRLVTSQTGADGQLVNCVLIEEVCEIVRELYLSAVIDYSKNKLIIIMSSEGGVEVETIAEQKSEKVFKISIDPLFGILPYHCRELGFKCGLDGDQRQQFIDLVINLGKMFVEKDLSLAEINPLAVTTKGELLCLDAKVNVDDNALFRQESLAKMRDVSQEDERETHAREFGLSYVVLDGDIGCIVNGAGLAMATMDLIKTQGGSPANFLDVGGLTTKERVAEGFKLILSDKKVKSILINIFGGIVLCDLIAEGIIKAMEEVSVTVPVVVRLEGNNSDIGARLLKQSGLNIITADSLKDAAEQAVKATKGGE